MTSIMLRAALAAAVLSMCVLSTAVKAQTMLMHLPLDGSLDHSGRVGDPRFVVRAGEAEPSFVPGRYGQALRFDSVASLAIPFNLDHSEFPRVTVTAWVREEAGASGTREIFSSTSTQGVRVGIHGGRLVARVGQHRVAYGHGEMPEGEWVFVAAVIDTEAGSAELYVNDQVFERSGLEVTTSPPRLVRDPDDDGAEPEAWMVVGAFDFRTFQSTSRPLVIDDVRVYEGLMTDQQIADVREPEPQVGAGQVADTGLQPSPAGSTNVPGPNTPAGATPGGSLAGSDQLPLVCEGDEQCPDGTYCAIDRTCHPNEHAPLSSLVMGTVDQPLYTIPPAADDEGDRPLGPPRPIGTPIPSRVSGEESDTTVTLQLTDDFITTITWNETGDRPCNIEIQGKSGASDARSLNGCGDSSTPFPSRDGYVTLEEPSEDALGYGVRSLRVCSNMNNNRRMKGLRIRSGLVQENGGVIPVTGPAGQDLFNMPNCDQNRQTSSCDDIRLATGVIVHYTRASGRNEQIVGLQILCSRIGFGDG